MRSRVSLVVALAVALIVCVPAIAGPQPPATNILYGVVTANRTLTYASPGPDYYVPGDVVVNPGVTLTIEPGVTLLFPANGDTLGGGDYPSLGEIIVQGSLVADGTAGDSIRFVSTTGGLGTWGQIKVELTGSILLKRGVIRGATQAIRFRGSGLVADCTMTQVSAGVLRLFGSTGSTSGCVIQGGGSGIGIDVESGVFDAAADSTDPKPTIVSGFTTGARITRYSDPARLSHLVVYGNVDGITSPNGGCEVTYCTSVNNTHFGVFLNGSSCRIYTSIATHNGSYGLIVYNDRPYMNYTNSWNNVLNYGDGRGLQTLSYNPLYVDYAGRDFRLSSGSPFKTYGPWGAEIGAYGPGPGSPVRAEASTWGRIKGAYR
jgi:hypothetical protein